MFLKNSNASSTVISKTSEIFLSIASLLLTIWAVHLTASVIDDETEKAIGKCNGNGALMECLDSDGNDQYTKGKVKAMVVTSIGKQEKFSKTDFCNDNQLFEWTCDQNKFAFNVVDCPDGCSDGACKKINTCTDTDGNNNNVKGTVTFNGIPYVDKCTSDNKYVIEQTCKPDNTRNAYQSRCENGCDRGACQPRTCSDPDSGKNDIFTYGVVTQNGKDYSDKCSGTNRIIEQLCNTDKLVTSKTVTCPNEKICSKGKCLK